MCCRLLHTSSEVDSGFHPHPNVPTTYTLGTIKTHFPHLSRGCTSSAQPLDEFHFQIRTLCWRLHWPLHPKPAEFSLLSQPVNWQALPPSTCLSISSRLYPVPTLDDDEHMDNTRNNHSETGTRDVANLQAIVLGIRGYPDLGMIRMFLFPFFSKYFYLTRLHFFGSRRKRNVCEDYYYLITSLSLTSLQLFKPPVLNDLFQLDLSLNFYLTPFSTWVAGSGSSGRINLPSGGVITSTSYSPLWAIHKDQLQLVLLPVT